MIIYLKLKNAVQEKENRKSILKLSGGVFTIFHTTKIVYGWLISENTQFFSDTNYVFVIPLKH